MLARSLVALSAAIVLALGIIHLVYTFRGPKLTPRDPAVEISMSATAPVISRETTMWKAWIGFNAAHSRASGNPVFQSGFLLVVGFLALGSYAVLAKAYWFSVPFTAVLAALACYAAGAAAGLASSSTS